MTRAADVCSHCRRRPDTRDVLGAACCESPWCEKVILFEVAEEERLARELETEMPWPEEFERCGSWFDEELP